MHVSTPARAVRIFYIRNTALAADFSVVLRNCYNFTDICTGTIDNTVGGTGRGVSNGGGGGGGGCGGVYIFERLRI